MRHIFLSYSHSDRKQMLQVHDELTKNRKLPVWVDDELTQRGSSDWMRDIEHKIANSSCMVVFLSPSAKQSKWVTAEITYALNNNIEIFPALLWGDENDAVPLSLLNHQRFSIYPDYSEGIKQLVAAVQSRQVMERPEELDNYLIVPLSAAYFARQELSAAGIISYLADSELWHRIDFGDDIVPKSYENPYPGVKTRTSKEIASVLGGFYKIYRCYVHGSDGRREVDVKGNANVAFLRPKLGTIPDYLESWHDELRQESNMAKIVADIENERQREKQLLEASQATESGNRFCEIIMQVGEWLITEYGLECIPEYYNIEYEALEGTDWAEHMSEKKWVNYRDFMQALNYARQIHSYLRRMKNKQE